MNATALVSLPAAHERLARAWFDEWEPDEPQWGWASDWLFERVWDAPQEAWPLIVALVEYAPSTDLLACVAAGPLEDLLCLHGPQFIEQVEAQARRSKRFRRCLVGVWGWSRMDPAVYARLLRARKQRRPWRYGQVSGGPRDGGRRKA